MTNKKRGAPSKYETHVKPRFDEIRNWLTLGATEKEVFENLGVKKDAWIKYKKENKDLTDLIKSSRKKPVDEIKKAMMKRAVGFQYEEKKVITQSIKFDDERFGEIPAKVIKTEITTKTALPDVAAGLVLLKHWAKDEEWTSDPQSLEIKKKELALKEKQIDEINW